MRIIECRKSGQPELQAVGQTMPQVLPIGNAIGRAIAATSDSG
jgi:hypothetical protein